MKPLILSIASLALVAAVDAPAPIVAEAQAFMNDYARDLAAGNRAAIAARYSREGAFALGWSPKRFDDHATIVKNYAGSSWTKPAAFAWRDLSFEPLGPDAVAVVGHFDWTTDPKQPPMRAAYTGVLRRENGALRIRIEHENKIEAPK